jgi:hypothetical protein
LFIPSPAVFGEGDDGVTTIIWENIETRFLPFSSVNVSAPPQMGGTLKRASYFTRFIQKFP